MTARTLPIALDEQTITDAVAMYTHLHAHPELSAQEHETAAYIERALDDLRIEHFRCGGTGVVGLLRNGDGPVIGFRADTDGLPIAEQTGLPYASTATGTLPDGEVAPVMHGCGHDTHITAALTAARMLSTHREVWHGTVVLIFQPGEETAYGAKAMVADGLWDRAPRPDVVFAQHVMPAPGGSVIVRPGPMATLADSWRITVHGRQAHGSEPERSIDPIVLGAAMVLRLQTIVSRELSPRTPAVVTVGTFHAGLKENIIPDRAQFTVNVRTPDEDSRSRVLAAIRRIIAGEAAASGAPEPVVEELNSFPRLVNDDALTERLTTVFAGVFGADHVDARALGMGSEDAGWLWDAIGVPGVFWGFGAFDPALFDDGAAPAGNHSPQFAPDARMAVTTGTTAALAAILEVAGTGAAR
ncbi:amidohydrolase [Microbacterium luticocti]|uniref:amidohydrolase n=1 Tax=Microbacterium luticocti TaxID=451764 RepID=UPI000427CC5A|nr:amidohydrolase [Microbacterium luticocti]